MSNEVIVLDLADPNTIAELEPWGGMVVARVKVRESSGKYVTAIIRARTSGDSRAGSQRGVHLEMRVIRKDREVSVERHLVPWDHAPTEKE